MDKNNKIKNIKQYRTIARAWYTDKANFPQELYLHKKTGVIYDVICNAISKEQGLFVIYRNLDNGNRWAISEKEFNDGRFERINQ